MKTNFFLFLIVTILVSKIATAQNSVNDYKYVVVPTTLDFLTEPDQYRLNTLTKLLLEKHGFTVIMEDEKLPDDAISNDCLLLDANVLKEPGLFNTKLKVQLTNCKKEVIFTSAQGKSNEKKYQVAYTIALREAFKSFEPLHYTYKENAVIASYGSPVSKAPNKEIEKLKKEIKTLKEEKEIVVEQAVTTKEEIPAKEVVSETTDYKTTKNLSVLYAQKVNNGYQLVDKTPKVVYTIKKTNMKNVFLVEGKPALIYKLATNWFLEYYENEKLQTKILNIKF